MDGRLSIVAARGVVRDTGGRGGSDVVQVYAELPDADAPMRLVGFSRVEVPPGGEKPFEIVVPVDRLATRDAAVHRWQPAAGRHRFVVARHAGDPEATTVVLDLMPTPVEEG